MEVGSLIPGGLPWSIIGIVVTVVVGVVYTVVSRERPLTGFPIATLEGRSPKKSWLWHGPQTMQEALNKYSGPFQVMTGTGPKIILPNRFAQEIRNNPHMNFPKAFSEDFFTEYPGFEAHKQGLNDDALIRETIRNKLTQSLGLITGDIVDETTASLHDVYGENSEWQTIVLKDTVMDMVARLSSRVFLGKDLCRNPRWLQITKTYTIDSFISSYLLRMVPALVRPLVYWVIPHCTSIRKAVRDAHRLIDPEVERRKAAVDACLLAGEKPPKTADSLGWMHEIARGRPVDYVAGQLTFALASMHSTTETTCQALLNVCKHPDVVQALRQEIIEVIGVHGWAKTSLYKLKLMDSFLKETARCGPMSLTSMFRYVEKEVTLSDGTTLPRGSRIMVSTNYMDASVYPEPDRFDASRFLELRAQPGQESSAQFVATSPDYLHFGLGQHACPGRFFAANEVKIALCQMLLKYDWRFVPGTTSLAPQTFEIFYAVNPKTQVQYRRRQEEIEIDFVAIE